MTQVTKDGGAPPLGPAPVRVGLLGFGVVGGGVVGLLSPEAEAIRAETGRAVEVRRILVRDLARTRAVALPEDHLTTDAGAILDDPQIDIVVEMIGGHHPRGGLHPARHPQPQARGHGQQRGDGHPTGWSCSGRRHGVDLYYEASVGGASPSSGSSAATWWRTRCTRCERSSTGYQLHPHPHGPG